MKNVITLCIRIFECAFNNKYYLHLQLICFYRSFLKSENLSARNLPSSSWLLGRFCRCSSWVHRRAESRAFSKLSKGMSNLSLSVNKLSKGMSNLSLSVNKISEGMSNLSLSVNKISEGMSNLSLSVNKISEGMNNLSLTINKLKLRKNTYILI